MEGGLPMLNCLLQHTLRSLCTCSDSSKWVYAVFWRILPRNYPPPKWDHGGGTLDRAKGNKRNWILVWEDGFCDFYQCEQAGSEYIKGRFGAEIFFKMSHEVYNFGEGLVGKVAADNSHKWVFRDSPNENDPSFISSWNVFTDPQPRAWGFQFNSGIQTIAIISVREGIIQLGSFDKIVEDLNLVISVQRKFSYLQSIPGIYAIQRPYLPIQHPYTSKPNDPHVMFESSETTFNVDDKQRQLTRSKRLHVERPDENSIKCTNLGYNSPHNGIRFQPLPHWSIPPLLPSMSCSFGALLSKLPSVVPPSYDAIDTALMDNNNSNVISSAGQGVKFDGCRGQNETQVANIKVESCVLMGTQEEKSSSLNPNLDGVIVDLGFGHPRQAESALNLN
ncbi:hypothetical protein RJ639_016826 [Escallonia herrerae]|uniref:Transcription factor MYC/MYB N-terminal domain-containing protein n=1 Tax=Escallonia herrerae TaxID=1293975 RepID=A0AA88VFH6_9ASTE|nr:hypothetical protein RJ639_016826 [Escallonia herrerae]